MRWPIHIQLLLPMLAVVVLAIALASAASGYLGATRVRQTQEENLRRVVATLTEARFPLSESILRQMSGLSGAEFIFLDDEGLAEADTLSLSADDLRALADLPRGGASGGLSASPPLRLDGQTYLGQRLPVTPRGPTAQAGSLVVLYPEQRWSAPMRQALFAALGTGAIAVAAVGLVATLLARRFARPIRRLGDQTAAIARGDFTPVEVSPRNDELRDLAISINRMTEQLGQYEGEVRKNEQLRTLGQLGAGMAHQLRNAATGACMAIELHARACAAGEDRESLDVALRQLRLMESYLQRFLTVGRPRRERRADRQEGADCVAPTDAGSAQGVACPSPPFPGEDLVSLETVADDVAALVRPACVHARIELSVNRPAVPIQVRGDAEELRQLLVNLVLNAVDATQGHGEGSARIVIDVTRSGDGRAAIHVKDSGPGPAETVAARLFQPFVTGKPEGTGLGLFVARQIAEDHRGTLRWERCEGMTWFTLELPAAAP